MMLTCQINNTIIFYHPETGCYNIKIYIPHKELKADVVIDKDSNFELSEWHMRKDGKIFSVIGQIFMGDVEC